MGGSFAALLLALSGASKRGVALGRSVVRGTVPRLSVGLRDSPAARGLFASSLLTPFPVVIPTTPGRLCCPRQD